MTLIFDTGSSWLWIPTKESKECRFQANLFDQSSSLSYRQIGTYPEHIQYGGGSVWGYHIQDQVCLVPGNISQCMTNYNMLGVFIQSKLEGLQCDGILGLAPTQQNSNGDMFINRLKKDGVINQRIFSFSFGGTNEQSLVIFGGYDMKYAKPGANLTWNPLIDSNYWTVRLMQVRLGNYTFQLDTYQAIIDTGTSYILIPQNDFLEFKTQVSIGRRCVSDPKLNLLTCTCMTDSYSDFPDLELKIGENVYKIPSTSYMTKEVFRCLFHIMPQQFSGDKYWILGDAFLINYYTIYDLDQKQVGFVGSVHVETISYWYEFLIITAIVCFASGAILFGMQWYKDIQLKTRQIQIHQNELTNTNLQLVSQLRMQNNNNNQYMAPNINASNINNN